MFGTPAENSAYLLALRYLKYRPRSIKEISEYLIKKQIPKDHVKKIINKLLEQKFLNDEAFAQSWVRTRIALKPLSQRVLRIELIQKGISKDIIDNVLSDQQASSGNDLEMARILVQKRKDRYGGLPKEEIYKKLGGFLARRGFQYDTIKTIIDDIFPS